ncbi:unnamed protein product [Toxocara canis]|uniref:DDE_Tnp_1_7 domain-containing protein n=1 Tax=Toxocara canis TaxID=6265 RepID=A0A183V9T4_TOXCA|nr:unnamed protein product [Toxocara canis]
MAKCMTIENKEHLYTFGGTAFLAAIYFCEWKTVGQFIPLWNARYVTNEVTQHMQRMVVQHFLRRYISASGKLWDNSFQYGTQDMLRTKKPNRPYSLVPPVQTVFG